MLYLKILHLWNIKTNFTHSSKMEPYCTSLINRRIPYWRPLASSESITAFKFLYWKFNIHFSENKFPSMVNDFPSPLNILESRGKTLLTINSSQWGACLWIHAKIQNISLAEHFITKWLTICIRQLRTVLPLLGLRQREMTKNLSPFVSLSELGRQTDLR